MRFLAAALLLTTLLPGLAGAQDGKVQGKTVKEWAEKLKNADARGRYAALAALAEAGPDAEPFVKDMAKLLKDGNFFVRRGAAQTLGGMPDAAAPLAGSLAMALRDSDAGVRQLALQALVAIGDNAVPALAETLNDKEPANRMCALAALDSLGVKDNEAVIQAVGKATKDASVNIRRAALWVLSQGGAANEDIIPFLTGALHDKDNSVRNIAGQILFNVGKDAAEPFAKVAGDPNPALRLMAVQALTALGEDLEDMGIVTLRKALADTFPRVRLVAVFGIGKLGTKAREFGGGKELYEALIKLMEDKDVTVRRLAVYAMGQVGIDEKEELMPLALGLKDRDVMVRVSTVEALSQYANEDTPAEVHQDIIGYLLTALKDTDRRVAFSAAQILVKEGEQAVKPLIATVEKGQGKQRGWAAGALGEIGAPDAAPALPCLEKLARDSDQEVRQAALAAIKKIKQ